YPEHFRLWEKIGDWDLVVDQDDVRALQVLLDQVSSGLLANLARRQLQARAERVRELRSTAEELPGSLRNARAEWQIYECHGCGAVVEAQMAELPAAARCPSGCVDQMTHKGSWPADAGGYGSRADLERLVRLNPDDYWQREDEQPIAGKPHL